MVLPEIEAVYSASSLLSLSMVSLPEVIWGFLLASSALVIVKV